MNTKLSIALLSGFSLFMSIGAFAVADEKPEDYLNWSYAMGEVQDKVITENTFDLDAIVPQAGSSTCTEGCNKNQQEDVMALTISYEDEIAPVSDQTEFVTSDSSLGDTPKMQPVKSKIQEMAYSTPNGDLPKVTESMPPQTMNQVKTQVETRYVTTEPKVQYPVTRQYPVSVEYPVTVQRNMTVEQPVIIQQPVIVRRPVVMQQDITVKRQPTVVQNQPVVMNQQPTFMQQQPMFIQAPAQPLPQAMMTQMMTQTQVIPQQVMAQPQPLMVPQQTLPVVQPAMLTMPQQYQIQGQVQAQPVYTAPDMLYMGQQIVPQTAQPSVPMQQPTYQNPIQQ